MEEQKTSNKKYIFVIIVICLLVIGLVGYIAYDKSLSNVDNVKEIDDKNKTVDNKAEKADPENSLEAVESIENGSVFTLYSLDGEKAAEITVPDFLPEINYTKVTLTANDEMTYEAAYGAYNTWDADTFFDEAINVESLTENDMLSDVKESDVEISMVNGKKVSWKKISAVYDGDIKITQYAAAVGYTGGVVGVELSATGVANADAEFMDMLSGVVTR